jgi:hypothetical protein
LARNDIPVRISVGNIHSDIVASLAHSGDVRIALALFFRAFADELDGGEPSGATSSTAQPQRSPQTPAR